MVSTDGGVPLVSHAYPGNKPDGTQFGKVNALGARSWHWSLDGLYCKSDRRTLVYDAGQNSDDNYELFDGAPCSFVGSLPPSEHLGLLAVPKDRYQVVDQEAFRALGAFETAMVVYGKERRLVVCHSAGLHAKQSRGYEQTLAKPHRQLAEVSDPPRPGKDPKGQGEGGGRDRRHPRPALGGAGDQDHPRRSTSQQSCASASAPTRSPGLRWRRSFRQADPGQ